MGVAFYPILERDLPGVTDSDVDGKALASAHESLDDLARAMGVRPLADFISVNAEMAEFEEHGLDVDDLPPEHWSSPADALVTVRALVARSVEEIPAGGFGSDAVFEDLRALERVLDAADAAGVRFRLAIDI
jgi:hypothetical protein